MAARGVHDCEDLALYLLENYEIATLRGQAFNSAEDLCRRVSSSRTDADSDEAGANLVRAYRADPDPERAIRDHHPRMQKVAERFGEFIADLENG